VPLFDAEGGLTGAFAVVRDITARKAAEFQIYLASASLDTASFGMFWFHPDGKFFRVNRTSCLMTGYTEQELLAMSVGDLTGTYSPETWASRWHTLREKKYLKYESQQAHKDGHRVPTAIDVSYVNFEGAEFGVGFARDITSEKQAEENKKNLEAQLRRAHKLEALGVLVGGVAHEFNNVLLAISINTELARDYATGGSQLDLHLEEVLKAGDRAKNTVEQILRFSRRGKSQQSRVPVARLVEEALKLLRASMPATIELHRDIDPECGTILANPTELHQVVMNLCLNACQAMKFNRGSLDVNLRRDHVDSQFAARHPELEAGPHVRLEVRDDGVGMAPEIQERIFDPFFTTKEVGQGTGLGLAVVHGIVRNHGGAITLRSQPGEGTAFVVYFPLLSGASIEEETGERPLQKTPENLSEHILLVDDEEIITRVVEKMLSRLGYKVTARTDSEEALDLFRAQPGSFDMVITDLTMPKLSGIELTRELKKLRPDLPILMATGHGKIVSEETANSLGVAALVSKPFRIKEIAKTIRQVLDQQSSSN